MATVIQLQTPRLPDPSRLYSGRPALAADGGCLADALNHVAGWRQRALASMTVECGASSCIAGTTAEIPDSPPVPCSHLVRMLLRRSGTGRYLWVSLDCVGDDESTGAVWAEVYAYAVGGAWVDRGVRWSLAAGTITVQRRLGWVPGGGGFPTPQYYYDPCTVHNGTRIPDPGEVVAAAAGEPRLLDLATVTAGSIYELVAQGSNCRILSVSAWEYPGPQPVEV